MSTIRLVPVNMSQMAVVFFCLYLVSTSALLGSARPLQRSQRQTLTGEIATGLTGAGTSFNPIYDGQRTVDSYYGGYSPQTQVKYAGMYDDPSIAGGITGGKWNEGNLYGQGLGGVAGIGGVSGGVGVGGVAGVDYAGGLGTTGYNYGQGNNAWRGFGAGRNPYRYGQSNYGAKY